MKQADEREKESRLILARAAREGDLAAGTRMPGAEMAEGIAMRTLPRTTDEEAEDPAERRAPGQRDLGNRFGDRLEVVPRCDDRDVEDRRGRSLCVDVVRHQCSLAVSCPVAASCPPTPGCEGSAAFGLRTAAR